VHFFDVVHIWQSPIQSCRYIERLQGTTTLYGKLHVFIQFHCAGTSVGNVYFSTHRQYFSLIETCGRLPWSLPYIYCY